MTTPTEKPRPPEDWECCESGCSPCVWDHYYKNVKLWEESQKDEPPPVPANDESTPD